MSKINEIEAAALEHKRVRDAAEAKGEKHGNWPVAPIAIGVGVGLAMGNLAVGIAVGMGVGLALGAGIDSSKKKKAEGAREAGPESCERAHGGSG